MLAGTLTQRVEIVCAEIFDRPAPPRSWPELRRLALADLEESIKLNPDQADAQYMLGRLNALPGGDRKQGLAAMDAAVRLTEKDRRPLEGAADSGQPERRMTRGAWPTTTRRLRLLRGVPKRSARAGMYYLLKDKIDLALADLNKAIELDPNSADTFEAKGVALLCRKTMTRRSSRSTRRSSWPRSSLDLLASRPDSMPSAAATNDKALAELERALELQPRAIDMLLLRARVYQQARKFDKALIDVNQVLRMSPGMEEALQAARRAGRRHRPIRSGPSAIWKN